MLESADDFTGDEPLDAERWLYLHSAAIIGATTAAAIALIEEGGLVPQVHDFDGARPAPQRADPSRIQLLVGDDGKVRWAQAG